MCCDSTRLSKILDLHDQPLANSYTKSKDETLPYFPLGLNYCNDCTHLQLTHAVNPDLLFKNYLYVSGTTKTLKEYFDDFVNITDTYSIHSTEKHVLDIACNDGSQLDSYKKKGYYTYGIDPAENLYELSSKNHNIVCDYFTEESISKLNQTFDVIIGQNVFAHNTYPYEFLKTCKKYLNDGGKIFIQTSQADMIKQGQFDTVYHEHISFFNVRSMHTLINRAGLYLQDVIKTPIHGNSYVFVISANSKDDNSDISLKREQVYDLDTVNRFASTAISTVDKLNKDITEYRNQGYMVVGYGAAAKGNTVLNFGKTTLDYIVDDNPLKQGLYTPGMTIPIVSLNQLNDISIGKKVVWIPLSWNFFKEIKENINTKRNNPEDKFIQLSFTGL